MATPRLLLADDRRMIRDALRAMLEPDAQVVGVVEDGREVARAVEALAPDLVLLSISLPGLNGLAVTRDLVRAHLNLKVLVLTTRADPVYADEAMSAGARGFVVNADPAEVRHAVAEVLAGRLYVTPLVPRGARDVNAPANGTPLTPRQVEVLRMVAQGHTTAEIARELGVTAKAVEFHRARIKRALGLRTNAAMVRYAVERGIV